MRFALLALSAMLLVLTPAQRAFEAGLPPGPKMDTRTALSGLLASGFTIVGAVGSLVMMQRASSVYLCNTNVEMTGQMTDDHVKRLAAQLPSTACFAVS